MNGQSRTREKGAHILHVVQTQREGVAISIHLLEQGEERELAVYRGRRAKHPKRCRVCFVALSVERPSAMQAMLQF